MTYLVAVSGGIDSVVLLDMLVHEGKHDLIVAHFDHGIRSDSAEDARFVEGLAKEYNLPFIGKREELGEKASEELARTRRYAFLREAAASHRASLVTAHHADDLIETIAINIVRGTGWRGLAVLDAPDIERPLLSFYKQELRAYACDHRLEWVEDSTNATENYLRNRVRKQTSRLAKDQKRELIELWKRQKRVKRTIEKEVNKVIKNGKASSRYFLTHIDTLSATEIFRSILMMTGGNGATRPQLERALLAIKTAKPGTKFELGRGMTLEFSTRLVVVKTP